EMGPVPAGVGGELYIGGECLARGYLNRPGLTAERFVPDPFSGEAGGRLYRTGDVVRHVADGVLEYLGRADEQVKVRGFRVELGEIEAVLATHELVGEAVAVAREDGSGMKRVVAYVVPEGGSMPTGAALREYMRERVPEYMIPSYFVTLERMPLTSNGKVDKRALPEPGAEEAEASETPRTPVEEVVAGLWVELLGCQRVGTKDSFFSLGGHSLLATQMLLRIRKIFKVDVPLRELFESPTVAGLAKNIELAMGGKSEAALAPITPADRGGALPLSFAQQRLWFLDQLKPGSAFYNVPLAVRLTGRLDVGALESTLTEVVRRHEVLRTHFDVAEDGQPVQVIAPPRRVELPPVDLSGWDEGERMAEAQRLAKEEAERAFNLSTGPLLRAGLIRLGEEEHVMLLTMHHIVSDGWSSGILIREVAALYEAYSGGMESPLDELPVQYADFAVWQREYLHGEALGRQLTYWKEQLTGAPAVLELPTDRPRPAVQSYRGANCSTVLDEQVSEGLRELARRQGATLYMVLLAAFQALLSRYTGQSDIVVGTPIANRNRAETEGLIGFFTNTQVMRVGVDGREPFAGLLGRVREACLGAYAHQDVPFEMLVEELQPERSLSYSPLFQVMFVLQNYPLEDIELPGLRLDSLSSGFETTKFDLTLFAVDDGGGRLRLAVEYSTALFDRERMERMLGHMETLLAGVVADPQRPVAALPLLNAAEREQLLGEWGVVKGEHDPQRCVHELFEAQAEQTPESLALVYEDEQLTYAELNARANRLAHHLRALGVGPDVAVGIMLQRSVDMVVSLLAVLKAGGAYVPLDPAYPRERLAFMLEDARARVLLTDGPVEAGHSARGACRVLILGDEREAVGRRSDLNPPVLASPDNLAYVIYTSGSTGRPKGIGLPHVALTNLIEWHFTVLSRRARVLQFASLSFDASFHEIFAAVCSGGTVYLISEALRVDTAGLARFISSASIEKAILPVVALQQLAETFSTQAQLFGSLREVVTTGEQMHITRAVTDLFKQLENCTLHNHYGPSESHVVTSYTLPDSPDEWVTHPPVGRPVSHTQIYITDRDMNPVPAGVAGELLIGGVSLARGYVGRPGATAEKFIPDPFSQEPGARLYRTGDLACFLPGGDIKYLGRIDHQLKIRGFRVEPGEIESALG
ncbi:MAG TPA: amino acid adenylation domain-containing protein, partial [Pyrinomonadaceae bacterium]|nr:amino acid adenylation domain-containing protein [Pyrinomonadaceae bacterium]